MIVRLEQGAALHLQIYRAFREAILSGALPPGSRLPSTRAQARDLGVSRNVVLQAYGQLEAEGYVGGARGSGTYVAGEIPEAMLQVNAARDEPVREEAVLPLSAFGKRAQAPLGTSRRGLPFDFVYGLTRPDATTSRQWQRAIRRASEAYPFDYPPPEGDPDLREAIVRYLRANRAVRASSDQIVVTSGSQQALGLISRVLFEPGDRILLEEPCYQGARRIFAADGLRLVPCPVGEDGLDAAVAGADARGASVTPSHQFPTGVTMPLAKRLKLLAWAEERNAVVIEDDYDSEYRYEGRPLEAIQSLDDKGRVVYVGTLSKVLFPALRVGFVALPKGLVPAFVGAKWLADRQASVLEQKALAEVLRSGEFDQHLRRARARNQARREALLEALRRHLRVPFTVSGENAGIHLLVWFPERTELEVQRWIEAARDEGVGLYSVAPYYATPARSAGLLVGFGNLDEVEIEEGIRRFSRVIDARDR